MRAQKNNKPQNSNAPTVAPSYSYGWPVPKREAGKGATPATTTVPAAARTTKIPR